jgi:hypothetical protein
MMVKILTQISQKLKTYKIILKKFFFAIFRAREASLRLLKREKKILSAIAHMKRRKSQIKIYYPEMEFPQFPKLKIQSGITACPF